MAMNGTTLGDAIVSALVATDPTMTPDQVNQLKTTWIPVATAIVQHIQTFAEYTITADTIVTTGGPTTQTGPTSPVTYLGEIQ